MTKQEEIWEGLNGLIGDCLIESGCAVGGCPKAEQKALEAQETLLDKLLQYLHSQGVVIKTDDIRYITAKKDGNGFIDTVSVEPLIEEDK